MYLNFPTQIVISDYVTPKKMKIEIIGKLDLLFNKSSICCSLLFIRSLAILVPVWHSFHLVFET